MKLEKFIGDVVFAFPFFSGFQQNLIYFVAYLLAFNSKLKTALIIILKVNTFLHEKKKDYISKSLGKLTLICIGFNIILKLHMFVAN